MKNKELTKNILLSFIIIFFLCPQKIFANFQNQIFCTIKNETLTVTLSKDNNYLCKNYIQYLQIQIENEKKNIKKIELLIQDKENKDFRKKIQTKKKLLIKNMNALIKKIQYNTIKFENNLTNTIQKYIKNNLEKEIKDIEQKLRNLSYIGEKTIEIKNLELFLFKARQAIQITLKTNSIDMLIKNLKKYIYFKQKITGILES